MARFKKGETPEGAIPFKKGQSGNLKGKPAGIKNRSTVAKYWLQVSKLIKNPMNGTVERLTNEDLITLAQIHKAIEGKDTAAYKALMDSLYGAPMQQVETVSSVDFKDSTIVFE